MFSNNHVKQHWWGAESQGHTPHTSVCVFISISVHFSAGVLFVQQTGWPLLLVCLLLLLPFWASRSLSRSETRVHPTASQQKHVMWLTLTSLPPGIHRDVSVIPGASHDTKTHFMLMGATDALFGMFFYVIDIEAELFWWESELWWANHQASGPSSGSGFSF